MAKSNELLELLFASVRAQSQARRAADPSDKVAVLCGLMLPHQRRLRENLHEHPSRHISVISPRQTGKSTGVMFVVTAECFETAGAEWVVIGLTRPSVKRIYWSPLKKLNEMLGLGLKFHEQELIASFPNGSRIYFVGGDTIAEIEKLRGGRYHGAVVDECKSYAPSVFGTLLDEILQPALNTMRGPLILIGTPGDILDGEFYLATCRPAQIIETALGKRYTNHRYGADDPAGRWSLHVWTLKDNTAVPHLWTEALALKERNGWADDHPVWLREYLGQWVQTNVLKVYRYTSFRHDYRPTGRGRFGLEEGAEWRTVLGVDLGSRDGTAMVVWAYSPTAPDLWEVHSERRVHTEDTQLNAATIAEWYRELEAAYGPFETAVADPGGNVTLFLSTLAADYGVYLEPAEKREKPDHIELMNTDFDRRTIHILAGSALSKELREDRWDEKKLALGKKEEDRNVPNDVADAGLYAWRWCNHRRAKPVVSGPAPGTPAWWLAFEEAEFNRVREAARRRAEEAALYNLDRPGWWETN